MIPGLASKSPHRFYFITAPATAGHISSLVVVLNLKDETERELISPTSLYLMNFVGGLHRPWIYFCERTHDYMPIFLRTSRTSMRRATSFDKIC